MFKRHFRFSLIFLLLALIVTADSTSAQTINSNNESTLKVIKSTSRWLNTPLRIEEVKVGSLVVEFSEKPVIIEQSDWLKNLSFKVRNLTHKKITYISFRMEFPETRERDL